MLKTNHHFDFQSRPVFHFLAIALLLLALTPAFIFAQAPLTPSPEQSHQLKTIVLDPGHGGKDPGCSGAHSKEKHIALALCKRIAEKMRVQYPGINVILTRDSDVFVPLHERAAIANRNKADLFISVHCNAMPKGVPARGTETYVMGLHTAAHNLKVAKRENAAILLEENYEKQYDYDPNSPEGHIMLTLFQNAYLDQSILLADFLEQQFAQTTRMKSRGVKQAGFLVLKETAMPSVLIEAGFLTNANDEAFLRTNAGQEQMANATVTAFGQYKKAIEAGQVAVPAALPTTTSIPKSSASTTPKSSSDTKIAARPRATPHPNTATTNPPPVSRPTPPAQATPVIPAAPVMYHVQLAASPKTIPTNRPPWNNLPFLVEVFREDGLFKYQASHFSSYEQAFSAKLKLQSLGFKDAFIVPYQSGKRISMEAAERQN